MTLKPSCRDRAVLDVELLARRSCAALATPRGRGHARGHAGRGRRCGLRCTRGRSGRRMGMPRARGSVSQRLVLERLGLRQAADLPIGLRRHRQRRAAELVVLARRRLAVPAVASTRARRTGPARAALEHAPPGAHGPPRGRARCARRSPARPLGQLQLAAPASRGPPRCRRRCSRSGRPRGPAAISRSQARSMPSAPRAADPLRDGQLETCRASSAACGGSSPPPHPSRLGSRRARLSPRRRARPARAGSPVSSDRRGSAAPRRAPAPPRRAERLPGAGNAPGWIETLLLTAGRPRSRSARGRARSPRRARG